MKKKAAIFKGDKVIWVIFIFLSIVSVLAVYTSIGLTARNVMGSSPLVVTLKHLAYIIGGYLLVIIAGNVNYKKLIGIIPYIFYISVVLLFIALVFYHGRRMWGFQPSEFAKVMLIMYVARMLSRNKEHIDDKWFVPIMLIPILIVCGLIFPENLSTALILFVACYVMMFLAGVKKIQLLKWLGVLVVLAAVFTLINMVLPHPLFRFETWFGRTDRWLHPDYTKYSQENISLMAVARGGLIGSGIGNTIFGRLMTQAQNDFIYSIIVEEAGFMCGVAILIAYSVLFFRCVSIAWRSDKMFGRLLVMGIATLIYVQAWVHMCVCVGVIPVTGQTLPFVSYGGSAYIFMCLGLGAIQSVANEQKHAAALKKEAEKINQ